MCLCPKDYVRYKLTGEFAMDMQEASGTLLLDVTNRRWSADMCELAGIPMAWLPRLFEGPEICARIHEAGAGVTGLAAGTPVAAGAGDQGAGAVGMGILAAGVGVGDDWDEWGGVCGDRCSYEGPAGAAAYFLPCRAGGLACDGSDEWGGAVAAVAAGYVCGRALRMTS